MLRCRVQQKMILDKELHKDPEAVGVSEFPNNYWSVEAAVLKYANEI